MSGNPFDEMFGLGGTPSTDAGKAPAARAGEEPSPLADLLAEEAEPEDYRPYVIRARPQMAVAVIEAGGTGHGFYYHEIRHPKHQVREGKEYLTFTAGAFAVAMEGTGLRIVWRAMLRGTLAEVREHDGQKPTRPAPAGTLVPTRNATISRLAVLDTRTLTPEQRQSLP